MKNKILILLLPFLILTSCNNIYDNALDDNNPLLTNDLKIKIKDCYKDYDNEIEIKDISINHYFKKFYDNYHLIELVTKCDRGHTYKEFEYDGYKYCEIQEGFTGFYSENNKFIKVIEAYESSIISKEDLIEISSLESEYYGFNYKN